MLILFILVLLVVLAIPDARPTAAAIFFSIGPIIYDVDYFVKKWCILQKKRQIFKKLNFESLTEF